MLYLGLDVGLWQSFGTVMDEKGHILKQGRMENHSQRLEAFLAELTERSQVAMEAARNWYYLYGLLELKVRAIFVAHLLRTALLPPSYIPPREIRDLRELLRYRASLVRLRAQVKDKVAALLSKNGLSCPYRDAFEVSGRKWLHQLDLRPPHRQILDRYVAGAEALSKEIHQVSREIEAKAEVSPRGGTIDVHSRHCSLLRSAHLG